MAGPADVSQDLDDAYVDTSESSDIPTNDRGFARQKLRWVIAIAAFVLCVAPTFISYQSYVFQWDDANYMMRAVQVSRNFWRGDMDWVLAAMVGAHTPAMTLLGLPWGPLRSWRSTGDCFITLGAVISLIAGACLYLQLRIGVKPCYLVAASACVFASIGPYPTGSPLHKDATGFLSDGLLAWTILAALLLIPYEARLHRSTIRSCVLSGVVWGLILCLGVATKLSFLYFVVFLVPVLLFIKARNSGLTRALTAAIALAFCVTPIVLHLVQWGRPAFNLAKESSFGETAHFYYIPLSQFLLHAVRESPGVLVSFLFVIAGLTVGLIRRQLSQHWPELLALLIILGYTITVFASPNREMRFALGAVLALPFLVGILLSGTENVVPQRFATAAALLAICTLIAASIPMRLRPDRQSISRSNAVLAIAARINARSIVLATDSPTLNDPLLILAREFSTSRVSDSATIAYQAMHGSSIEDDCRVLSGYDLVVIQDYDALRPFFTNQRVREYERYVQQNGHGPIRAADDVSVYLMGYR